MFSILRSIKRVILDLARLITSWNDPRELPRRVQEYLVYQFDVPRDKMTDLRCVARQGWFWPTSTRSVRIFDMGKAEEQGVTIKRYRDLHSYLGLTLFYGGLRNDGKISLKREHRTPSGQLKIR